MKCKNHHFGFTVLTDKKFLTRCICTVQAKIYLNDEFLGNIMFHLKMICPNYNVFRFVKFAVKIEVLLVVKKKHFYSL